MRSRTRSDLVGAGTHDAPSPSMRIVTSSASAEAVERAAARQRRLTRQVNVAAAQLWATPRKRRSSRPPGATDLRV